MPYMHWLRLATARHGWRIGHGTDNELKEIPEGSAVVQFHEERLEGCEVTGTLYHVTLRHCTELQQG